MTINVNTTGTYDTLVQVERIKSNPTKNDYGEVDLTSAGNWELWFCRWASVRPLSGREFQAANATQADVSHRVKMHSDTETRRLTPKERLSVSNRKLEIVRVFDVDSRNVEIDLECREAV